MNRNLQRGVVGDQSPTLPRPSRRRHFSLTKPELRAARLVTLLLNIFLYLVFTMLVCLFCWARLVKTRQKIYFPKYPYSEILTSVFCAFICVD